MSQEQLQLRMQGIDPLHGQRFLVHKRDGRIEEFNEARILIAIESAFKAHHGLSMDDALPGEAQTAARNCAEKAAEQVLARAVKGEDLEVERIQDMVEDQLMLAGHLEVARRYILYREKRRLARAEREGRLKPASLAAEPIGPQATAAFSPPPELASIYQQALPKLRDGVSFEELHRRSFDGCLNEGDYWFYLSSDLLEYDSDELARGMRLDRDQRFEAGALEALRERFLLRVDGRCLETPQYFWMRIAMGLALREEGRREGRALEFYEALSTGRFIPSDLILRNAGTRQPCLAYVNKTSGAEPRLEPWHCNILNTVPTEMLWLPDLFMQRVRQRASWTLLDPAETADLRECGGEFEARYQSYEKKAEEGGLRFFWRLNAVDLWRQLVAATTRPAHPGFGFTGAVEGRLLLPRRETAPLPMGAINLAAHISEESGELDVGLLRGTTASAVRMLDNAVDLGLYLTAPARAHALERRALGLGLAGWPETLGCLHLAYESVGTAEFAEWVTELICFGTVVASAELARERGPFPAYPDSKWSLGLLPIDTLGQLSRQRGLRVDVPDETTQDWAAARELISRHGIRNSALTTISPLDIPAQIVGLVPSNDALAAGVEKDPKWLLEHAARRQKWIDQDQALTFHTSDKNHEQLAEFYMRAWEKGIKTVRQASLAPRPAEQPTAAERAVLAG